MSVQIVVIQEGYNFGALLLSLVSRLAAEIKQIC